MHVVGSCLGWIVDTVYTCLETSMLLIKSAGNKYFICPPTIKYPLHMGMGPAPLKKPPLWSHAMPCCGVVLEAEDSRTELLLEISLVVKRQVRLRNGRASLRGSQMRSMSHAKLTSFVDAGSWIMLSHSHAVYANIYILILYRYRYTYIYIHMINGYKLVLSN